MALDLLSDEDLDNDGSAYMNLLGVLTTNEDLKNTVAL